MPILALAFIAMMLIGGCGGNSDAAESGESTITTSKLSKAAFIKKADVICVRAEEKIFSSTSGQAQKSEAELEKVVIMEGLVPALEDVAGGLRGVGAPAGDEAQVEAIVVAFEGAADQIKEAEPSAFPAAEKFLDAPSGLAKKYGLDRCVFS